MKHRRWPTPPREIGIPSSRSLSFGIVYHGLRCGELASRRDELISQRFNALDAAKNSVDAAKSSLDDLRADLALLQPSL